MLMAREPSHRDGNRITAITRRCTVEPTIPRDPAEGAAAVRPTVAEDEAG
ncbi:hypothetical protein GCM10023175_11180 [Pseudonocardia xishanensis]|uniref:Uncharacterized protein n=1 Tax=Pseudonocardia xishanensis TaxID=630995 RepID=A0ABP8RIL0_9PSEU